MEPVPNRGYRVVPLSDIDRQHIFELRVMLEVPAMRRVAEKGIEDGSKHNSGTSRVRSQKRRLAATSLRALRLTGSFTWA